MTARLPFTRWRHQLEQVSLRVQRCVFLCHVRRAAVLCVLLSGCGAPRAADLPYPFESREADALREILARDSTWRLAVEADSKNTVAIASLRESDADFTPYYSRDRSRDKNTSVAFVLTRRSEFKVLYLRSEEPGLLRVDEVAAMSWLDDGFVRLRGDSLDIALFSSGEIMSFVWDSVTGNMVFLPEDLPED